MEKLSRQPILTRAIQEQIKRYVTEQALVPGDPLPSEVQLAATLGVSRGSVREAIKALESLGIVEVRRGNGIFVREFNFDSVLELLSYGMIFDRSRIAEMLQLRKWLETAAIGEATERITDEQIREIDLVLAHWEAKIANSQSTAEEDRAFHRLLYAALNNQSLISLLDIFWMVYHAVPIRTITVDRQPATTINDHRDILEAVRRRDAAQARHCVQDHFRNIEDRIHLAGTQQDVAVPAPPKG